MTQRLFRSTLRHAACGLALWGGLSATALAQEAPMSAIDWLSQRLQEPSAPAATRPQTPPKPSDISENALPEDITVRPLGEIDIDATGLLSAASTGLPRGLWGASTATDLARRITNIAARRDLLPASRRLLNTLILTELDPPMAAGGGGRLFRARLDALLAQGLLDEADAMMARSGTTDPSIFRRSFDTKLLLGTENEACAQLTSTPGLSPTLQAKVFCLARSGDWNAAALTLETSDALGLIDAEQSELLARFLDPELFEDAPTLTAPKDPSPLTFRLMEAIGEPLPTVTLPLAFAQSDLRSSNGWKARATAAERLARVGALDPNRWLGIWSEHLPAASGGIWDRIDVLQRFEIALNSNNPVAVGRALTPVWDEMRRAGLQSVFADLFATRLAALPLSADRAEVALEVALLSKDYELLALDYSATQSDRVTLLTSLAVGDVPATRPRDALERAILDGFRRDGVPVRLNGLVENRRLGEAILRAIELLEGGAAGDLDELSDALQFFRSIGLGVTARRAALELLLLERRG
ncbi:hypothetical protein [Celeribacter marinus]|uniref:Antifreeze glycopeptide polyprotein n=1 Tax=Celeribacter marinus TaxID=1397108 RepID=A0A0N9ZDV2_9RHOB|nr:hypothetical protein [Celeribacter marinus]ALI54474.1 hypothetical protein IMCC12053_525 [Celeribacter marinus]